VNVHNVSVGITGHQQIADNAAWPWVTQEIERVLKQHPRAAGVSSLAKGADQVFAEVVIRCEMSLIVIIPCRGYEATFDKMGLAKYKRMLNLAYKSQTLDYDEPSEDAFFAAGREIVKRSSLMIAV